MAIPPARDTLAAMGIRYPLVGLNYVPDTSEMHWTATRDLLLEHIHGHIMQPHQVMPLPGQSAASVELHQSFDVGTHDDDSLPFTPTVQTADANRWRIRNDGPWGLRIEHCMTCESHERHCAHTFPCLSCQTLGLQCVGLIVYLDDDSTEFTNFVDAWTGFRRTHNLPMGDWSNPVPRPLGWHASSAAQDAAQDAQDQAAPLQGPVQAQAAQSQALVAAAPAAAPIVAPGPAAAPASAPPVAGRSITILTSPLSVAPARGVMNTVPGSPDRWVAPPQCYMTAIEILTYFPEWLNWPECLMRFIDAGWEQVEMSKYVLWCRGLPKSRVTNYRTALWHRAKRARSVRARTAGFNTASWNVLPTRLSMNSLTDYRLADVVQNVVHHPPAAEQGEFWRCLNHQQSNAGLDLRLSDIPALLRANPGWRSPAPTPRSNPDGDALARWRLNPGRRTM